VFARTPFLHIKHGLGTLNDITLDILKGLCSNMLGGGNKERMMGLAYVG
jgi:hypothetical protein